MKERTSNGLDASHRRTLEAIADALLPTSDDPWRASVARRVEELLGRSTRESDLQQLKQFLGLLDSPAFSFVAAGRWSALSALSRTEREAYLRALARHRLAPLRGGFATLKRLVAIAYYADADADGYNPVWASLGYPGPIAPAPNVPKAIQPLRVTGDSTLDCDVVVVGSGAGGGTIAAELARADYDVIVVEQGGYFNESDFNQREVEMLRRLYLDAGLSATDDLGVTIQAGSCLGGGTVVNYTTSFRTPDALRAEWAGSTGLGFFESDEFTRSLDAAEARLQVNRDHNRPSTRDDLLERGLKARGWHADRMPRNVIGCTQDDVCGFCGLGCVRGAKRSTLATSLPEAYARGARILVDCTVDRVVIAAGRATGVAARTRDGKQVTIRARRVVVAAGAIHSPALLLRSGVGGPIGHNLHLHPVTGVSGEFDEPVRPWTGTLQAIYSDQFADLDGGYGVRFETAPIHPLLLTFAAPWDDAAQFDRRIRRFAYLSFVGLLLRDRDSGRVTIDRAGRPRVHYSLSRYDRQHVRIATEGAARVLLAAGAREIVSTQNRLVNLRAGGSDSVEDWLKRVDQVGYGANQTFYVSFHQMGSCRMGSRRQTSVVNEDGESHEVKDLFVADASLFPSASGVNPMVTIVALAHHVGQRMKARTK